jgi:hypothetical protein
MPDWGGTMKRQSSDRGKKRKAKASSRPQKTATRKPKSLVQFFAESPLIGSGINLEREPDFGREVDL